MHALDFTRLSAHTIDRVCLAGASAGTPDAVAAISSRHDVDVGAASLIARIIADDAMTWDELGVPMRYTPPAQRRGFADHFATAGILSTDNLGASFTENGRAAAQAYVNLMPDAIASLWQIDTARIPFPRQRWNPYSQLRSTHDHRSSASQNALLAPRPRHRRTTCGAISSSCVAKGPTHTQPHGPQPVTTKRPSRPQQTDLNDRGSKMTPTIATPRCGTPCQSTTSPSCSASSAASTAPGHRTDGRCTLGHGGIL